MMSRSLGSSSRISPDALRRRAAFGLSIASMSGRSYPLFEPVARPANPVARVPRAPK